MTEADAGHAELGRPPAVGWREALLLLVGAIGLAVAVIGTRWGVFTPDTRPDLYQDPAGFLSSTVQAWVGGASGLGQGNFNAGAAPVAVVVWVIRSLGASPWLAVRIWRLLILLLGAWGIRRYLGVLLGRRLTVQGRVLATAFWVVNPYVIVSGSTTPILLPYALLPWTMLAFLQATRNPRSWRWPAAFGLAFFAQTGLNAGVVPFFQLLALPGHLAFARWAEGRSWRDLVRVVVRAGLCALAVSLYWLLPSFLASGTGAGIASGTENPADVARTSSYAETMRGLGNWPLYGRSGDREFLGEYTIYLTSPFVVLASFLIPVAVAASLLRSRARERLLVVGLLLCSLPVMVGLFPPEDPSPFGRLLAESFERVPALLAFRTTNKVGAVVVLAQTIALVLGWRAWQARARHGGRALRATGLASVAVLVVGISAPLWNGGLYPLGYTIPQTWERATSDLDQGDPASRVLAVPGGTGGNYRWGMRSPDDLFPSLLERPVAVRNTVVGRGEPAGNFLSTFDTFVAQGALPPGALSTTARYLGADSVLVRNDLLTEEIGGPQPYVVVAQADDDPDLSPVDAYGRRGTDTVPGSSGRASRAEREADPRNASVQPLLTYDVADPLPVVRAAPAADQVLVVGDGEAVAAMQSVGIVDGTQPLQFLGDLDDAAFAQAVRDGGRVVLTDTNRRRAWDVNRTANATSATLTASDDIDGGDGATVTRWPDSPDDQTVAVITGGAEVGADRPGFGLHPFGRATNAFDGDPGTAWLTGGFQTAPGSSIWIEFPEPRRVDQVVLSPYPSDPSQIVAVRVRVGTKQVIEAMPGGGEDLTVGIEPTVARRVEVTLLDQTGGANPVGFAEISIDGTTVRNVTRAPLTLDRLAAEADEETLDRLAELPLDVVLTRARGSVGDLADDEESQLDRSFSLPADRTFELEGELAVSGADREVVAAARAGSNDCWQVAQLDGEPLEARVVSSREELAEGVVRIEGCDELELAAGDHELRTIFGWRLDRVHLASPGAGPVTASDPAEGGVRVLERSSTRMSLEVGAASGPRYLRIGEAFDERWTLTVDGEDAGPPILVDGYSTGWRIDGAPHRLEVRFAPQRAVQATFAVSAAALVGVVALAVLPAPAAVRRRRQGARRPSGEVAS